MEFETAFSSEAARKNFIDTLPPPIKGKMDGDILIPVVITTKQMTGMLQHQKQFLKRNQGSQYLTMMWKHGSDANNGPHKYVITSLWAIKQDIKVFKKVGAPYPIMAKWYNSEEEVEVIKKFVKIKEFNKADVQKYIHYANVYLTEDKAYVLHFKGQQ